MLQDEVDDQEEKVDEDVEDNDVGGSDTNEMTVIDIVSRNGKKSYQSSYLHMPKIFIIKFIYLEAENLSARDNHRILITTPTKQNTQNTTGSFLS